MTSIRSFMSRGRPVSPTGSQTTSASVLDLGDDGPRVLITRADLRASVKAYEGLLAAAKAYRNALIALSTANTAFAVALEECARVKGAGESGEQLLAASGLEYMNASSNQVLSDTLYKSFEIPLLHAYDTYVATVSSRHAEYELLLADKTAAIRQTEAENLKQGRKKSRDLSQFRKALERLQEQVREVEVCKRSYYGETLEHETDTWSMIGSKVALLLRSTLDLADRLSSKATSDPVVEAMLTEHPDPFDSYRLETEEDRDVFTILPPLGNLGALSSGSKRGSLIDLDKESVRHGFRLSWESQVWTSPTGTPRDPPLSAHGVDQAKELAQWLAELPEPPQAIYSSPLYRCLQTATPAADALNLPIFVEHGIAEWYLPVRRGLHPRSLPASRLLEWFPRIDTSHDSLLYPTQKGETTLEVHARAKEALSLLFTKLDAQEGLKTVVLFLHAATNIACGRALTGDPEKDIKSATCSVGKYVRLPGGEGPLGKWDMVLNGDTSFLTNGEERHWDFSYVEEYEEDGILEDGTELPLASDNYKTPAPGNGKL